MIFLTALDYCTYQGTSWVFLAKSIWTKYEPHATVPLQYLEEPWFCCSSTIVDAAEILKTLRGSPTNYSLNKTDLFWANSNSPFKLREISKENFGFSSFPVSEGKKSIPYRFEPCPQLIFFRTERTFQTSLSKKQSTSHYWSLYSMNPSLNIRYYHNSVSHRRK
jgi:hypothetical protein